MELLIFLVQRHGDLVTREEIAGRLWGKDVFLDVDHSINTAIRKVRAVLRDDSEKPRFIETVVGKGYRFAAPVTVNGDAIPQVDQPTSLPVAELKRVNKPLLAFLVGLAVCTVVSGAYLVLRSHARTGMPQPIRSLAVLPLKNLSGDPNQDYFADGMTEELIGRLSAIRQLRLISRTSVMRFKDSRQSIPEIARILNVDAVVEGSVVHDRGRVRINAQLIRGATDEHLWSESYERQLSDTIALQSEVAQAIADKIQVTVTGEEHARLIAARHVDPDVYESYLKARMAKSFTRAELERSIANLNDAVAKDPTFAPAYVGLADSYTSLATIFIGGPPQEMRQKAEVAARRALELDPGNAEAHAQLANIYQQRWHWPQAEAEFKRALELQPNYAKAHSDYALWLVCQGRTDEALKWVQRGRELDPVQVDGLDIAWILFLSHRFDESIREVQGALAVNPDDANVLWLLGFALMMKGQAKQAVPVLEKAVKITHSGVGPTDLLAAAYIKSNRRPDGMRLVAELKRRRKTSYVPAGAFIIPYLSLGDYDEAFAWMNRAHDEQSNILQFLKVHAVFDPVRNDPRFVYLLLRVGLN